MSKPTAIYRSALKTKGGQWTEGNLDKYLKSPADYAPGKNIKILTKICV